MKNFLRVILCMAFALPAMAAARHDDGDYVVVLNGNIEPNVVMRQHGVARRPNNRDKRWVTAVHGFSAHLTGAQADRLEADIRVAVIEPDVPVHALVVPSLRWLKGIQTANVGSVLVNQAATADRSGNIIVAGSANGPVDFGSGLVMHPGFDAYIAKYTSSGTLAWGKFICTNGNNFVTSLAADASGNIYAACYLSGTGSYGATSITATPNAGSFPDAVIVKYNSAGVEQWAVRFGDTGNDYPTSIALDSSGNPYVCLNFNSTSMTMGAFTLLNAGLMDIAIAKLAPANGAVSWAVKYGSTGQEIPRGIAIDKDGNIALTGDFSGTCNLGGGATATLGNTDMFVAKYSGVNGAYIWSHIVGSTGQDNGYSVATDPLNGNVHFTGHLGGSANFGGGVKAPGGLFVATYSTSGAYVRDRVFNNTIDGFSGGDVVYGIATDSVGNIAIAGQNGARLSFDGIVAVLGGGHAFTAEFTSSLTYLWHRSATGNTSARALALDLDGNATSVGTYAGTCDFGGSSLTSPLSTSSAFTSSYGSAPASTQLVPLGVKRIGTLSNAVANIGGHGSVNADVAVIDTGIDLTHPDLNVYQNVSFVPNVTTGNDDAGHGSHVAGIIGAKDNGFGVVGVAPGCRLWAVKVLDSTGNGASSQIISGVDYVTQHASEIEVANMSLGGQGPSAALRTAIQASVAKGVIYVVAAGNSAFEIYGADRVLGTDDDFFPAAYPEVCTVSALVDTDGFAGGLGQDSVYGKDDTLGTFSNWSSAVDPSNPVVSPGGAIDVAAPGVSIYSTYMSGGYTTLSGTSMACPHVAGAMALWCASVGRATTAAQVYAIRQAIIDRADAQTTWGINSPNPFPNDTMPEGLLSVLKIGQNYSIVGAQPVVTITAPTGTAKTTTDSITFTATATDAEDGNVAANLIWTSSLMGQIGTGATFTRTLTTAGNHTITARVTDSDGNTKGASVSQLVSLAGNTAPVVTITSPTNTQVFLEGATVTLTGTATDTQDGNISSQLKWYYGSALLGTGASVPTAWGKGDFTVKAVATDSGFLSTTNQVAFTVGSGTTQPTPPTIHLTAPAMGATVTNVAVTFTATATDDVDGDIKSLVKFYQYTPWRTDTKWFYLGVGSPLSAVLDGNQQNASQYCSAVVTNTAGLIASNQVNFTWNVPLVTPPTPTPPSITINQPLGGQTFPAGYPVIFDATAYSMIWGNLGYNVQWISSRDGMFWPGTNNNGSVRSTVTNATLTVGQHKITAQVFDGETPPLTNTASLFITIASGGSANPSLTVTASPNKTTYARKEKATFTATIKSGSTNISGAQVTFTMTSPGSASASGAAKTYYSPAILSDSSGRAVYIFQVPPYRGLWSVTVNATKANYVPGRTTFTFTAL